MSFSTCEKVLQLLLEKGEIEGQPITESTIEVINDLVKKIQYLDGKFHHSIEIASNSDRSYSWCNTSSELGEPNIHIKGPTFTIHEEDSNEDLTSNKDFSPPGKSNNNKSRSSNLITSPINNLSQNKSFQKGNSSQDMNMNIDFTKAANTKGIPQSFHIKGTANNTPNPKHGRMRGFRSEVIKKDQKPNYTLFRNKVGSYDSIQIDAFSVNNNQQSAMMRQDSMKQSQKSRSIID